MLTPYPPPSLLILTPTTGRLIVAGEEEVLIEGGQVDVLAEEMEEDVGVDLSVGVCYQKYEEPGPCGSAGDFLLGEEI